MIASVSQHLWAALRPHTPSDNINYRPGWSQLLGVQPPLGSHWELHCWILTVGKDLNKQEPASLHLKPRHILYSTLTLIDMAVNRQGDCRAFDSQKPIFSCKIG